MGGDRGDSGKSTIKNARERRALAVTVLSGIERALNRLRHFRHRVEARLAYRHARC